MSEQVNRYHQRQPHKAITDREEMLGILEDQLLATLAMCHGDQPYLITVNHVYDRADNCLYFHCAKVGRKWDYLKANPLVYGQVLEDNGYSPTGCAHDFRSVQFSGRVEFIETAAEMLPILEMMIDKQDVNSQVPIDVTKKRLLTEAQFARTAVVRVRILEMTGKRHPPLNADGQPIRPKAPVSHG